MVSAWKYIQTKVLVISSMNTKDWTLLSVVIGGEYLEIDGVDIWMGEWNDLSLRTLEVPHPSYPSQKHMLHLYYIESQEKCTLFMAGELSNCVWCFYIPSKGQPMQRTKGMTINEKLFELQLHDEFDQAINTKNWKSAREILILAGLSSKQARETVSVMEKNPINEL